MAITVYSERYVAFLDILGFSDIVRRSTTLPEKATELSLPPGEAALSG